MPRILLYRTNPETTLVCLNGTLKDGVFGVASLTITIQGNAQTYSAPTDVKVPDIWLEPVGADFAFKRAAEPIDFSLDIPLGSAGTDLSFLGRTFSGEAGFSLTLRIHLTGEGFA